MNAHIRHRLQFTVSAIRKGEHKVTFTVDFQKKLAEELMALLQAEFHLSDIRVEATSDSEIIMSVGVSLPLAADVSLSEYLIKVNECVALMTTHGADGDLLRMVLARYPQLRGDNVKLQKVISAFNNFVGVTRSEAATPTEVTLKPHEVTGAMLQQEPVKAPIDKLQHRQESLLGQNRKPSIQEKAASAFQGEGHEVI